MEIEQILKQGEGYFTAGNLEAAKECFRKILETDPNHIEALNNLGAIAFHEGAVDNAISYFRKVLEIDKDYLEATENLGKCLELKEDFLEALKFYKRALQLGGLKVDILNSMGNCFTQLEELKTAYEVYKKSFQIDGSQVHIKFLLQELKTFIRDQEKKGTHCGIPLFTMPEKLKQLSAKDKCRIQISSFSDFETDDERRLRWGDYWVKYELEKEFEKLGHTICDKESDIIVHLFGVPVTNLPEAPYKIIWIHSHPDMVTPEILSKYDKIYCLSPTFLETIKDWGFDAELLIAGTSKKPMESEIKYDIVFVGNTKGKQGRKIIRDLGELSKLPYNLKVWGEGWKEILPERAYGGLYYDNQKLGELYASSLISLNDHHDDMRYNGFINPRILDILASGGLCISDNIVGLEKIFKDTAPRYKTPEELRALIDNYIANPKERLKLVKKGCKIALSYSFKKMVKQLLKDIESKTKSQMEISIPIDDKSMSKPVRLDLGCGKKKQEGFIGLDIKAMIGVDIVCDVTKGIPLQDNSVCFVIADNLMEHIGDEFIDVMNDIWRVCKLGSKVKIIVPGVHTIAAFQDPTHKRFFVLETFDYFNVEHERWKLYGSSYGIKPFKILSAGLRETDQRFIEVEMLPVKDKGASRKAIERQEHKMAVRSARATKLTGKNVLVSFGFVPHSTAAYLIRALKKKGLSVRSCGPLDKTTLLKTWTNEQLTRLVPLHDVITDRDTSIIEVINSFKDGWYPDLFLWIESSMNFPNFPSDIPELKCPSASYFIDSHTKIDWHLKFAPQFDYVFLAQRAYTPAFEHAGCRRVSWLPLACDPEIHGRHDVQKKHDISFVGNLYPGAPLYERRSKLLHLLQKKYDLKIEQQFFEGMAESFSRARLVFNISARDDLNMRVFEALASGSMLLTDEAPNSGLTNLFTNGEHLVIYQDEKNLIELAKHYLGNEEERERIAHKGCDEVLRKHTYDKRIQEMLEVIQGPIEICSRHQNPVDVGDVSSEFTSENVRREYPWTAKADIKGGETLFAEGKIEEAEKCFLSIIEKDPGNKEAYNNLGVIAFQRQDIEKAVDYFSKSLETDPFYRSAVLNFCGVMRELGQLHKTLPFLEKIIVKYPDDKELNWLLEESKVKAGNVPTISGRKTFGNGQNIKSDNKVLFQRFLHCPVDIGRIQNIVDLRKRHLIEFTGVHEDQFDQLVKDADKTASEEWDRHIKSGRSAKDFYVRSSPKALFGGANMDHHGSYWRLEYIVRLLSPFISNDCAFLDFGAGLGDIGIYFSDKCNVTLFDVPGETQRFAKFHADKLDGDICFLNDIKDLKENVFDLISAQDVLEHIENPMDTVEKLYRALKPGGHFITSGFWFNPNVPGHLASNVRYRDTWLDDFSNMGLKYISMFSGSNWAIAAFQKGYPDAGASIAPQSMPEKCLNDLTNDEFVKGWNKALIEASLLNIQHPVPPPEVSVVIPTMNRKEKLEKTIDSLLDCTERTLEIIIVDDSTDGSHDYINNKYRDIPNVIMIHNEVRMGLVASANLGAAVSVGSYVIPFIDDLEAIEGWDSNLISLLEDDPLCGAVVPLLLESDGTIHSMGVIEGGRSRKYPELLSVYGAMGWNGRGKTPRECPESQSVRECEYGCIMMLKRSVLEKVGWLDERFIKYCADPDWGMRIRLAGYKILYCPGSIVIYHDSSDGSSSSNVEFLKRDQEVFFEKWGAYFIAY